jgi:hypothetical protein
MIGTFKGKYDFLSNFYTAKIFYDGFWYPSLEHAYQASKTMIYDIRLYISNLDTAAQAKRYGKKMVLRPYWTDIKIDIMKDLIHKKFAIPELRIKLLETGQEEIVELNYWNDIFWGICNGIGENNLGKILMNERYCIRSYYV